MQHPIDEPLAPLDLASLDHALEDEVERGGVGRDLELAHLVCEVEHLVRRGPGHEAGAEVVVEEVGVGAVGLAGGGVEGADPELEDLAQVVPLLLGRPLGEALLEVGGAEGGGQEVVLGERGGGDEGGEVGGGGGGGDGGCGVAPVVGVEGAAGGGVRGERGGVGCGRGELGLLGEWAGGADRGAEEEGEGGRGPAVAAEEKRGGGRRRCHCVG